MLGNSATIEERNLELQLAIELAKEKNLQLAIEERKLAIQQAIEERKPFVGTKTGRKINFEISHQCVL